MDECYLPVILLDDAETIHNAFFDRGFKKMKVSYFDDTDTLYIGFQETDIIETRDLDDNTLIDIDVDVDVDGNIVGITLEHASKRTDVQQVAMSGIAA